MRSAKGVFVSHYSPAYWSESSTWIQLRFRGWTWMSKGSNALDPAKIFDNLYVMGRSGTAVYAITKSDGIMLIDSGYPNEVEQVVIGGMKKVGLDPANIKVLS